MIGKLLHVLSFEFETSWDCICIAYFPASSRRYEAQLAPPGFIAIRTNEIQGVFKDFLRIFSEFQGSDFSSFIAKNTTEPRKFAHSNIK